MAGAGTEKRSAAFRLGLSAERRAALFMAAKGYRTLAKRWKTPVGEIDLVVQRGALIAFIEVKARAGLDAVPAVGHPDEMEPSPDASEALSRAHEHALSWLAGLPDRSVPPSASVACSPERQAPD